MTRGDSRDPQRVARPDDFPVGAEAPARAGQPYVRRRTPPRPYAKQRTYPSVTTVIGVMDKPGLSWGAAKETALFAYFQRDEWEGLDEAAAIERLRKHHRVLWDVRAAVGTLLHSVNEAWSWDEDADLLDLIATMDRPPNLWKDHPELGVAEVQPYVDGLEKFWNDFTPATIGTEEVVRLPDKEIGYIGQCDWRADIAGARWRVDLKSTAKGADDAKPYTDSWRPQVCAYDRAPEIVYYTPEGVEDGTTANERAERFGVVQLTGDGDYRLIEIDCGDEAYEAFMALRRVYDWGSEHKKPSPRVVQAPATEGAAV